MTETRWLHFRIDEKLYERLRAAAVADRRSIANWVAVTCEHALNAQAGSGYGQPQRGTEVDQH